MTHSTREPLDILYELVKINNDRIEGYTKAIELLSIGQNTDLRAVFEKYRDQSLAFKGEIMPLVLQISEDIIDKTRIKGKLFRAWVSLKTVFSASDRTTILDLAAHGENEFTTAYANFLDREIGEDNPIRNMILRQQQIQCAARDHIKLLQGNVKTMLG